MIYFLLHQEISPLHKHNPKIAKELQFICSKTIAKNLHERYENAEYLAKDIEKFLEGELIETQRFLSRFLYKLKKYKKFCLATSVFVLLLVIVFVGHSAKEEHKKQQQLGFYFKKIKNTLIAPQFIQINSLEHVYKLPQYNAVQTITHYLYVVDLLIAQLYGKTLET